MDPDSRNFFQLKEWWEKYGNKNIEIWRDYFGYVLFCDIAKGRIVARIMNLGGPWFFKANVPTLPFTKAEKKQINRFVSTSNATISGRN